MGDGPIQPIFQPVAIDTMLNNNGLNIGDGLNFVTCERTDLKCYWDFLHPHPNSFVWFSKTRHKKRYSAFDWNLVIDCQ